MNAEETVLVPVPVWLLGDVYAFLAERMGTVREEPMTSFERPLSPERMAEAFDLDMPVSGRTFTAMELGLLKRTLEPRSAARVLLDLCAQQPEQQVAFDDLARTVGQDPRKIRGQLGALTKILKKLFRRPEWPITTHWGAQGKQQATYEMSAETARLWLQL